MAFYKSLPYPTSFIDGTCHTYISEEDCEESRSEQHEEYYVCIGGNYAVQQLQLLSGSLFKKNQSELARGSKFNVNIDVNRVIDKSCSR